MAQKTMYPAQISSPGTELAAAATAEATEIMLLDASKLPDAPNLATIGSDETAEVVLYTGKDANKLTGVTRGFQGAAKSWSTGARVARYFTAYDHDTFLANLLDLASSKQDVIKLSNNYKSPTAAITEYPEGPSVFYVGGGTGGQGSAWATAAGATETFGWVETVRTGSAGYQTFTEMYSGASTSDTFSNRQFKRVKRDSNSFWQPFEKELDADDLAAHNADYVRQPGYAATAGTGAAYTVTLNPAPAALVDGLAITILPHADNTVADATLKIGSLAALPIRRQNGATFTAGSIKAGAPLALIKVGSYFLARSVGATGTATAAQVRAGATFSNESNVDLVGTLPVQATAAQTVTPGTTDQIKSAGIYDGAITIKGDANLIAGNIASGKSVFGIVGNAKLAEALAGDVVAVSGSVFAGANELIRSMPGGEAASSFPGVVVATFSAQIPGVYRISHRWAKTGGNGLVYSQISKNNVAYGSVNSQSATQPTNSPTYTTYTNDIALSAGDVCKIHIWAEYPASSYIRFPLVEVKISLPSYGSLETLT